jgi:methyltransferase (TIGR00027 family)
MDGVGRTALAVAAVRAGESTRPDRLFDDPYAALFLAAAPGALDTDRRAHAQAGADRSRIESYAGNVVLRTRFFDDYLRSASSDGIRQVVLLGAGLDTRAHRLVWPEATMVFELDRPDVLAFKDGVLPGCRRRRPVAADLRDDWTAPLLSAGFRPGEPAVWLAEGLFLYLSADEARRLLERITDLSAPGSRLTADLDNPATRRTAGRLPAINAYADLWKGGLPDTGPWLDRHGWSTSIADRAEVAARYGRPESVIADLLTAVRRAAPPDAIAARRTG